MTVTKRFSPETGQWEPIEGPGPRGPQGPPGPVAVSNDAGNVAQLGTDSLLYVPSTEEQTGGDLRYVLKDGDTMTGNLIIDDANFYLSDHDDSDMSMLFTRQSWPGWTFQLLDPASNPGDIEFRVWTSNYGTFRRFFKVSNATGLVTVYDDPTSAKGIATKQYVDGAGLTFEGHKGNGTQGSVVTWYRGSSWGSAWADAASGQFTVPVTGVYRVSIQQSTSQDHYLHLVSWNGSAWATVWFINSGPCTLHMNLAAGTTYAFLFAGGVALPDDGYASQASVELLHRN